MRRAGGRDELFAAWRTFFERIAATARVRAGLRGSPVGRRRPARLHRPPAGMVREHPIYVVTLARPELLERRPDWGAGRRNFVALSLEPLPRRRRCSELLAGLVPGLPDPAVARSSSAPTGSRSTRSRPSGCSSTEGRLELVERRLSAQSATSDLAVPGVAACADRRAARRARPGRSRPPPGGGRPRPDVHARRPGGRHAARTRRRSSRGSRARPPRAPRPRHRSAVAGARPVRLRAGAHPRGRLRDAATTRPPQPPPRRRPLSSSRSATRRSPASLATHYLDAYRAAPEGHEGARRGAGADRAARRGRPRGGARLARAGTRLPRAGARGHPRPGRPRGAAGPGGSRGRGVRPVRGERRVPQGGRRHLAAPRRSGCHRANRSQDRVDPAARRIVDQAMTEIRDALDVLGDVGTDPALIELQARLAQAYMRPRRVARGRVGGSRARWRGTARHGVRDRRRHHHEGHRAG